MIEGIPLTGRTLVIYLVGFGLGMALYALLFWRVERWTATLPVVPRWFLRGLTALTLWVFFWVVAQHPAWPVAVHRFFHGE